MRKFYYSLITALYLTAYKHKVKGMKLKNMQLSKTKQENGCIVEIEIMQVEILNLKGTPREEAIKAYHKLITRCQNQPVYLKRS